MIKSKQWRHRFSLSKSVCNKIFYAGLEVLTALTVKGAFFFGVTSCSSAEFGGTHRLLIAGFWLVSLFDLEEGGDPFLWELRGLAPNFAAFTTQKVLIFRSPILLLWHRLVSTENSNFICYYIADSPKTNFISECTYPWVLNLMSRSM